MSLPERVAFDWPVSVPDGAGGTETTWSDAADAVTCRARFLYLRGSETVIAARLSGVQPIVVTIRRTPAADAITPDCRMRDLRRGDDYNVRTIVPTDDRKWLELTCERGVAV